MSATVVLTQFRGLDANLVTMTSFWQHSFACGIAARSLSILRRESNIERFFDPDYCTTSEDLSYQEFPQRAAVALEAHGRDHAALDEVERADHRLRPRASRRGHHDVVEAAELYREVAANHHNPMASKVPSLATAAVHIADLLVAALGLGGNGESGLPHFSSGAWDLLGLAPSDLGRVAEDLLSLLDETLRVFTEK